MKGINTALFACFLAISLFFTPCQAVADKTIKIGVLAKRGAARAIAQWRPTAEDLTKKLKQPFRIVPLKFT